MMDNSIETDRKIASLMYKLRKLDVINFSNFKKYWEMIYGLC